jgi:hypothetical protein
MPESERSVTVPCNIRPQRKTSARRSAGMHKKGCCAAIAFDNPEHDTVVVLQTKRELCSFLVGRDESKTLLCRKARYGEKLEYYRRTTDRKGDPDGNRNSAENATN